MQDNLTSGVDTVPDVGEQQLGELEYDLFSDEPTAKKKLPPPCRRIKAPRKAANSQTRAQDLTIVPNRLF